MSTSDETQPSKYLVPVDREHAHIHRIGLHAALTGQALQMTFIYMPPDSVVGWHSHPQESFVTVIQGGYEIWVGEENFKLEPGVACWVPANTPHRATVGHEATVEIEVFAPPREDWAVLTPALDMRKRDREKGGERFEIAIQIRP